MLKNRITSGFLNMTIAKCYFRRIELNQVLKYYKTFIKVYFCVRIEKRMIEQNKTETASASYENVILLKNP